jgi:hypothetical protein
MCSEISFHSLPSHKRSNKIRADQGTQRTNNDLKPPNLPASSHVHAPKWLFGGGYLLTARFAFSTAQKRLWRL